MAKNNLLSNIFGRNNTPAKTPTYLSVSEDPFERYKRFESLYKSNNAYKDIARTANQLGEWLETLESLATPVHRSVEFYANRLLMGSKVTSTNQAILDSINQFWKWSNFNGNKDNYSRSLSKMGDLFIKIKSDDTKLWMEQIKERHVTEVTTDARGIVMEIRIDIPQDDGKTYTEFWTLDGNGYVATWLHSFGIDADLERLNNPTFTASLSSYGIDFIPIVYMKFSSEDDRAVSCFLHAIGKIDEANREKSRLVELLYAYNKPVWTALVNSISKDGIYSPDPEIKMINTDGTQQIQYVKGAIDWKQNIPTVDWNASLGVFKDMRYELEMDLPETKLASIDTTQLSGRAITLLLGEGVNRAKTARGNLLHGIQRINEMALTIGQFYGFFPRSIGSYVEGNFNHGISCDAIIPMDSTDKAILMQQYTSAGVPLKSALRFCEFTEEEIAQVMQDKQEEESALANSFLSNPSFNRG